MKIRKSMKTKKIIGVLVIIGYFLCCSKIAYAEETEKTTSDIAEDIIMETETSIIYDMGKLPAIQMPESFQNYENPKNPYKDLKTPAQITKLGDYYFIVDCYHNQVIYTRNFESPISEWKVMTSQVELPHAIASDGTVYLVADTENHRVLIFEWKRGRFQNTQVFENVGERPHYIDYDEKTDSFFVWSSMTGDMYIMKRDPHTGVMYIQEIRHIKELDGHYVRSFTISDDFILFPSGNNCNILIVNKNTFEVHMRYAVSPEISGMACMVLIGKYFYMTVSSNLEGNQQVATIIRTDRLDLLENNQYEDIYHQFKTKGIPYYIDHFQGMYYMTNHGSEKSVLRFGVENDMICHVGALY